jgi:polyhydroxyalkanoate synthesis repressor PhaR
MSEPRVIKKYPNRRLYDTVESRYITLADVRRLVTEGIAFVVIDKKTQEDITRSILLQVISEQEHAGEPLMSQDFLSQVIRSYGSAVQSMVGNYLEQSLKMFQAPRESVPGSTPPDPFTAMANVARQNYERWLAMQSEFLRAVTTPANTLRPKETGTPESVEPMNSPEREAAIHEEQQR